MKPFLHAAAACLALAPTALSQGVEVGLDDFNISLDPDLALPFHEVRGNSVA